MPPEGFHLYYDIFLGNTADVITLVTTVEVLKGLFGITWSILVCDLGLISEENSSYLNEHNVLYIGATRKRKTTECDELLLKTFRDFER